jgi:hypothetical protein
VWAGRNGKIAERDLRVVPAEVIPDAGSAISAPESGGHRGVYL